MRTTTLPLPAEDLLGRALQIATATFTGTMSPAGEPRRTGPARSAPRAPFSWLARMDAWFARQEQNNREAYLAQSQDIFDLERRLQHLERHGSF